MTRHIPDTQGLQTTEALELAAKTLESLRDRLLEEVDNVRSAIDRLREGQRVPGLEGLNGQPTDRDC